MRTKKVALIPLLLLLLLCSCGSRERNDAAGQLQEVYQSLSSCSFSAKLCWEGESEREEYVLRCTWDEDGTASVEVVEPEVLKGIRAEFDQEKQTLVYEDLSLAAGESAEELSAVNVLPLLVDAVRNGYILEQGTEEMDGARCARILFERTDGQGNKVSYAVWFQSGYAPVYAEVSAQERVLCSVEFSDFSAQEAETASGEETA